MYKQIYTLPFQSIEENDYLVVIEKDGFTGTSTELIGSTSPFTVETSLDNPLSPYRLSTATLKIFGGDYLQNLFTPNPQGVRVKLIKNNAVEWIGFITNDTYSQDYSNIEFEYEIELVNPISTLKYKKFVQNTDIISILDLIKDAISNTNSGINTFYLPTSITNTLNQNIYNLITISTSNFIDEQDEEMTYYEILEEIAKYLSLTITVDKNAVYFLDYIGINKNYNQYYKYVGSSVTTVTLSDSKIIQEIGYMGSDSSLSINSGKNKAKVNCSLYDIDKILPKFNDEGSIFVDMRDEFPDYTQTKVNKDYGAIIRYYKQPNYTFWQYVDGDPTKPVIEENPIVGSMTIPILSGNTGSSFVRTAEWKLDDIPSKLSLTSELQVKRARSYEEAQAGKILRSAHKIFSMKSEKKIIINKDVWFAIGLSLKRMWSDWTKYNSSLKASNDYILNQPAQFRVGNYYYNGSSWTTDSSVKFNMPIEIKEGNQTLNSYYPIKNNNTFDKGIGDIEGYTFKAPNFTIVGDIELTLFSIDTVVFFPPTSSPRVDRFHYYKDIEVAYGIPNEQSVYDDWKDKDSDMIYENVIDDEYVEEADEIELKICTFPENYNKLCHSSTYINDSLLVDLKYKPFNIIDKPEHIIIERIISYYNKPKFNVSLTLNNTELKPYTKITDNNLSGKKFIYAGNEIDYEFEKNNITLIEI